MRLPELNSTGAKSSSGKNFSPELRREKMNKEGAEHWRKIMEKWKKAEKSNGKNSKSWKMKQGGKMEKTEKMKKK